MDSCENSRDGFLDTTGYLVWRWLRQQRSLLLGLVGMVILALYGIVPTFQPAEQPFGRIYAAYGAVFIALSALGMVGRRPAT